MAVAPLILDQSTSPPTKRQLRSSDDLLVQGRAVGASLTALGGNVGWQPIAAWAANTPYVSATPASSVTYGGSGYVCTTAHTSGSAFDPTKWIQVSAQGPTGSVLAPAQADAARTAIGVFKSLAAAVSTAISTALIAVTIAPPGAAATTWKNVADPGGTLPHYQFRDSQSPARVWEHVGSEMRPENIGAAGDLVELYDVAISTSNGVTTATSPSAPFNASHVGKSLWAVGALSTGPGLVLGTTIASYISPTQVTLAAAADTALTNHTGSAGQIADGSYQFTDTNTTFSAADVGKFIAVTGADLNGTVLKTWISAYVSAHVVTLQHMAATTVTAAIWSAGSLTHFGTDDSAYITDALTYCQTRGAKLVISQGKNHAHNNVAHVYGHPVLGEGGKITMINPANTSVILHGDRPRVSGLVVASNTNARYPANLSAGSGYWNNGICIYSDAVNAEVSSCVVERSAQIGVFIYGAQGARVFANKVLRTWADGTHVTNGARYINIFGNFIYESLDDSLECTSYCNQTDNSSGTITGVANAKYGYLNKYVTWYGNISMRCAQGNGIIGVEVALSTGNIFIETQGAGTRCFCDTNFGTFGSKDVTISNNKYYNCVQTTTPGFSPIENFGATGGGYDVDAVAGAYTPTYYSFANERVLITANTIRGCGVAAGAGINVYGVSNDCDVIANQITGLGSAASTVTTNGISLTGTCSEVHIFDNRMRLIYGAALYTSGSLTGTIKIDRNHAYDIHAGRVYDLEHSSTVAVVTFFTRNTYADGPTYNSTPNTSAFFTTLTRNVLHSEGNFISGVEQPKLPLIPYNSATTTWTMDGSGGGAGNTKNDIDNWVQLAGSQSLVLKVPHYFTGRLQLSLRVDYNQWAEFDELWTTVLTGATQPPPQAVTAQGTGAGVQGVDWCYCTADSGVYFQRLPHVGLSTNFKGNGTYCVNGGTNNQFALSSDFTYNYLTITAPSSGVKVRVRLSGASST